MANQSNIKVGIFGDMETVPKAMRNAQIVFSPKLDKFAILDSNGKVLNFFDFEKYKQFTDINVIVFNGDCKKYLDSKCLEKTNNSFNDEFDDVYQPDNDEAIQDINYENNIEDLPILETTLPSNVNNSEQNIDKKPVKDPTRRLFGFFLTTAIVVIIIIIVRLFALPAITQIQALI